MIEHPKSKEEMKMARMEKYFQAAIFTLLIISTGCNSRNNIIDQAQDSPAIINTEIVAAYYPTDILTNKPTETDESVVIIDVTQIPPTISNTQKGLGEYIYDHVLVTVHVDNNHESSIGYFNLDDLSDNSMEKSDLEFRIIQDRHIGYSLFPTNNATLFFSTENEMDYSGCYYHLSEFRDTDAYPFLTGIAICVLTNEGRIGVVNYKIDSIVTDENNHQISASFIVTVYAQQVKE
jgi:hypothetical protein